MDARLEFSKRSALQYNEVNVGHINEICQPLFDTFGIKILVYSHFFNNGTYLDLCTNQEWQQHYIEHFATRPFITNYMSNVYQNSTQYTLWNNDITLLNDEEMRRFISDSCYFDIWHGFSIYKHYENSIEAWHFGTNKENFKIINFYLNNLELLNGFISFFQNKCSYIIEDFDLNKLIILEDQRPLIIGLKDSTGKISEVRKYREQTKIKHFSFKTSRGTVYISNREAECIAYLSTSKTVKEIARSMDLSPRTIESYLESAKRKLGCWTRSELLECFSNSQKHIIPHLIHNSYVTN